jgi:hypothetical protein
LLKQLGQWYHHNGEGWEETNLGTETQHFLVGKDELVFKFHKITQKALIFFYKYYGRTDMETCFKELAHAIMEYQCLIREASTWRLREELQFKSKISLLANSFLFQSDNLQKLLLTYFDCTK